LIHNPAINDVVLALQIWNSGNATFVASFVKQEVLCISIDLQSIEMLLENIRKVIFKLLFLVKQNKVWNIIFQWMKITTVMNVEKFTNL